MCVVYATAFLSLFSCSRLGFSATDPNTASIPVHFGSNSDTFLTFSQQKNYQVGRVPIIIVQNLCVLVYTCRIYPEPNLIVFCHLRCVWCLENVNLLLELSFCSAKQNFLLFRKKKLPMTACFSEACLSFLKYSLVKNFVTSSFLSQLAALRPDSLFCW